MKRITLIILAVTAVLAGSVSCSKINDIDKRLSDVENSFSQLEAQIAAGAYITSVDKTDDGCTFVLSNGQTYKVENGKDGEAVIADIKIEDNFVVIALKNGEIMKLSYQNPLSMVTLNIIPDFSDGSVYSYSDDGSFLLRVSVTPEKYIEKLSDNDGLICKADFRSVITKAVPEGPDFTVVGEITSASVEEGYMTASFTLTETEMDKFQESDYMVSFSMEDTEGIHGASTPFVPVSLYRGGEGGDGMEAVDMGLSVKWASCNLGASKPEEFGGYYQWGGKEDVTSTSINLNDANCPHHEGSNLFAGWKKYIPSDQPSYWSGEGDPDNKTVLDPEDDVAHFKSGGKWRMPTETEFEELVNNCTSKWTTLNGVYGREFTSNKNGKSIFFPAAGYRYNDYLKYVDTNGCYWSSSVSVNSPCFASGLYFYSDKAYMYGNIRSCGFSVRPVSD